MKFLQRLLAGILALAVFAAALVFASIALGVILAIALIAWAWLAWRGRKLRARSGVVVEGEYREYRDGQEVRRIVLDERAGDAERRDPP